MLPGRRVRPSLSVAFWRAGSGCCRVGVGLFSAEEDAGSSPPLSYGFGGRRCIRMKTSRTESKTDLSAMGKITGQCCERDRRRASLPPRRCSENAVAQELRRRFSLLWFWTTERRKPPLGIFHDFGLAPPPNRCPAGLHIGLNISPF